MFWDHTICSANLSINTAFNRTVCIPLIFKASPTQNNFMVWFTWLNFYAVSKWDATPTSSKKSIGLVHFNGSGKKGRQGRREGPEHWTLLSFHKYALEGKKPELSKEKLKWECRTERLMNTPQSEGSYLVHKARAPSLPCWLLVPCPLRHCDT